MLISAYYLFLNAKATAEATRVSGESFSFFSAKTSLSLGISRLFIAYLLLIYRLFITYLLAYLSLIYPLFTGLFIANLSLIYWLIYR